MSLPTSRPALPSPDAAGLHETIDAHHRGHDFRFPARPFGGALVLAVFVCAGLVVGWSGPYTKLVFLLPLALLAAGTSWARLPKLAGAGALALAWVALPASLHQGIELGGGNITLYLSDVALLVAVVTVCSRHSIPRRAAVSIAPFTMVVLFMLGLAFLNGSTLKAAVTEARSPLYLVGGFLVAACLAGHCTERGNRLLLAAVMWVSAVMTVGAATLGFPLNGRVESVHSTSGLSQVGVEATRILTGSTHIALACLCYVLSRLITSRFGKSGFLSLGVPAAVITALAFSRNSILAVAAAVVFTLLVTPGLRTLLRLIGVLCVLAALLVTLSMAGNSLKEVPGIEFVSKQATAYGQRVIAGLSPSVREHDSSVGYRDIENTFARSAFRDEPIVGHGWGFPYHPSMGPTNTFFGGEGVYYVHNGYWWLLVKGGLLALAAFAWLVALPLLNLVRSHAPARASNVPLAAALVGLLAVNWVAPMVNDRAPAALLGVLLALLAVGPKPAHHEEPDQEAAGLALWEEPLSASAYC